jgi:hydroxypyruvate reductase
MTPDRPRVGAEDPRRLLLEVFARALAAVDGRTCVERALSQRGFAGPVHLIAIGKAAGAMAEGACAALGDAVTGGLVIAKPGHLDPGRLARHGLVGLTGGHPLPTAESLAAGQRLLTTLAETGDRSLLFLISGGASSLVEVPAAGLGLAELAQANRWLLGSGLAIAEMNGVRKALSRLKGGGLLACLGGRPARALAISDVPGDDPAVIGSGLLVPDPDLAARARCLDLPVWLRDWVRRGLAERPPPTDQGPEIELVATLAQARRAAVDAAIGLGLAAHDHDALVVGDAAKRGRDLARALCTGPAGVHVWGGETTVRLPREPGRGGRNQHLALAAALELSGRPGCWLLSAGTDGTDGATEDAGALVDGTTVERAAQDGLDARDALRRADSGTLLAATGDLISTGPTGTNVMDLMIGLRR